MKLVFTIIFLLFYSLRSYAEVIIEGYVKDDAGEPLIGANVFLKGTFSGTSTDSTGYFLFTTEEDGEHILVVRYLGYDEVQQSLHIGVDPITTEIRMKVSSSQMDMVTITAGMFESGLDKKNSILKEFDILTTAGATGDITGALNTLPGTQTVGEEGKLYVRGGDDYETQTFIDGMRVINPYHTTLPLNPTRNRFSPLMFKGTGFSTGGYSAEYGQGLSSALILSTKEKADQTRTDFTIIPFGAEIAQCIASEKTSLAGKLGYFNMKPYFSIIPQNLDWIKAPESMDANLVLRQKSGKQGMIKAYGNFTGSRSSLFRYDIDNPSMKSKLEMDNTYGYVNTSYKNIIGKEWMYFVGMSGAVSHDEFYFEEGNLVENNTGGQIKLSFSGDIRKGISLKTGLDLFRRKQDWNYTGKDTTEYAILGFNEELMAAFVESDIQLTPLLVTRIGFRSEYTGLNHTHVIDPRISISYGTGKHSSVSMAYGQFHQAVREDLLRVKNNIGNEKAQHYILNYQFIKGGKTFRVEGYYKTYNDLVKYAEGYMYDPSTYNNLGEGYARGIDLFWRDSYGSLKNADYWISYSFLDTKRDYRDFTTMAIPIFASRHNVSVAYKQFFPLLRSFFSGTYTFASPRPYDDPNKPGRNTGRTPAYHDLSATVATMVKENIGLFFMCSNILGINHIFGYEFGTTVTEDGLYRRRPIQPPARRFLLFGVTITLSNNGVMNKLRTL